MPAERKIKNVEEMREWMEKCTVVISTDYTGLAVDQMTGLRRSLRERGVVYLVVKNTLALLAADAAGRPAIKDIIDGPTGFAYSYGEITEPAKALSEFIRANRSPLKIRGGVMGDLPLTLEQVNQLAVMPPRNELIAQLLGRLNAPITRLAYVLNEPVAALARVLQRRIESVEQPEVMIESVEQPGVMIESVEQPEAMIESVEQPEVMKEEKNR